MFNSKFKNIHNNIELMETLQFKNYIKSIVEEIIEENTQEDLIRKIAGLEAMMQDRSTTPGEKENASNLKKKLEDKLKTLKSTEPKYGANDTQETDEYDIFTDDFFEKYGFIKNELVSLSFGPDSKYYEDVKNKDSVEFDDNGPSPKFTYRSKRNPSPRKFSIVNNSDKERFVEFIKFGRDELKR